MIAAEDRKHVIIFNGQLGELFGKRHEIYARHLQDAFQGLKQKLGPKFREYFTEKEWHIVEGRKKSKCEGISERDNLVSPTEVKFVKSKKVQLFNIFHKVAGAGGKSGFLRIIIGVVLIIIGVLLVIYGGVVGAAIGYALISAGIGLVVGGIMSLITGSGAAENTKPEDAEVDRKPSFVYNGPVNVVEQGGPVPVVCGKVLTGSTVISAGIKIEQL